MFGAILSVLLLLLSYTEPYNSQNEWGTDMIMEFHEQPLSETASYVGRAYDIMHKGSITFRLEGGKNIYGFSEMVFAIDGNTKLDMDIEALQTGTLLQVCYDSNYSPAADADLVISALSVRVLE